MDSHYPKQREHLPQGKRRLTWAPDPKAATNPGPTTPSSACGSRLLVEPRAASIAGVPGGSWKTSPEALSGTCWLPRPQETPYDTRPHSSRDSSIGLTWHPPTLGPPSTPPHTPAHSNSRGGILGLRLWAHPSKSGSSSPRQPHGIKSRMGSCQLSAHMTATVDPHVPARGASTHQAYGSLPRAQKPISPLHPKALAAPSIPSCPRQFPCTLMLPVTGLPMEKNIKGLRISSFC